MEMRRFITKWPHQEEREAGEHEKEEAGVKPAGGGPPVTACSRSSGAPRSWQRC